MSLVEENASKSTIRDVARLCGVSIKTVSRVLNGESGVKRETRDRVTRIINEMGYFPHAGARSMRGKPINRVGLTLAAPPTEAPLSLRLLDLLFTELYSSLGMKGNYLCLDLNPYAEHNNTDYARGLWEQLVAGLVIAGPLSPGDPVIERIHRSGHPYVAIGRLASFPECSSASVDFEEGAYLSAKHLLSRGHRNIALLMSIKGYEPGLERKRGYSQALAEAGIGLDESLVGDVQFSSSSISEAVSRLLQNQNISALIDCTGAEDAESIRRGARQAGREIGRDLDLVAWTYTQGAVVFPEAAAHVWIPIREAAHDGIRQFSDWFLGSRTEPVRVLYPPTLYETKDAVEVPQLVPVFDLSFLFPVSDRS